MFSNGLKILALNNFNKHELWFMLWKPKLEALGNIGLTLKPWLEFYIGLTLFFIN